MVGDYVATFWINNIQIYMSFWVGLLIHGPNRLYKLKERIWNETVNGKEKY